MHDITPEGLFLARRQFLKLGAGALASSCAISSLMASLPPQATLSYTPDPTLANFSLTPFKHASEYVNFYEYATDKSSPVRLSQSMPTSPWPVTCDGAVEVPLRLDVQELIARFGLEERVYRFRCVEGWAMVVPWIGFPLYRLLEALKPTSKAAYVAFTTRLDPEIFPKQRGSFFGGISHPYVEGLRMDEALHPLTFIAVGMYGKPLPPQNGAPIRLIVPWKYGFKSIKSIDHITCVSTQPQPTWHLQNPKEYGFYANVNPNVPHPRWSQARERQLGRTGRFDTHLFNGYEKEVAHLYEGMDLATWF